MSNNEMYGVFLDSSHTSFQERLTIGFNKNILKYILQNRKKTQKSVRVLEIGVGKGYFAKACHEYAEEFSISLIYDAFDRNEAMLRNVKNINKKTDTYVGELPKISITKKKYDIVYCAFVVEHLNSGVEVYDLITNVKKLLAPGGMIVFLTPDSMSQKFEFFNIDYTHHYPTTSRNVMMAFNDAGINNVIVQRINGLCTYRYFDNPVLRILHKLVFKLYSYRLFSVLCWPFYRVPLYRLDNFFYRVFCFAKEENLMFVARD